MKEIRCKHFGNGSIYCYQLIDGRQIETTDTFLPFYTKEAVNKKTNKLITSDFGSRKQRWMIGVSVMSGCPVRCKFCATGKLKRFRNLTDDEIVNQVDEMINKNNDYNPLEACEFKINYTRMGEPFLNISAVINAIERIEKLYSGTHHYISTVGIIGADYSWIKENISLQISLHSFDENFRKWLIPYKHLETIENLGKIRTGSNLKTTINLSLVNKVDFNINSLRKYFPKEHFFIKLSPINYNELVEKNNIGEGVIKYV